MASKKSIRISFYIILLIFISFSLSRSFNQYYVSTLDGDIAESVLPYPDVQKTFDDPTGIKTIIHNDKHLGVNRFFSHYFLHKTFREIPILLQNFFDPIKSVYLTSATSKIVMQILILLLLTFIINGKTNIFSLKFIVTAALLIPFFQTNGKYLAHEIGIMDKYVSYCFFYALPLAFLLLYYFPIFLQFLHDKKVKTTWYLAIILAVIAIIACFSGPLNAPIILITNAILFVSIFFKNWKTNNDNSLYNKILNTFKSIHCRIYLFIFPITLLALNRFESI